MCMPRDLSLLVQNTLGVIIIEFLVRSGMHFWKPNLLIIVEPVSSQWNLKEWMLSGFVKWKVKCKMYKEQTSFLKTGNEYSPHGTTLDFAKCPQKTYRVYAPGPQHQLDSVVWVVPSHLLMLTWCVSIWWATDIHQTNNLRIVFLPHLCLKW